MLVHLRLGKERWNLYYSWCTLSHRAELHGIPTGSLPARGLCWGYDSNNRKKPLQVDYSTRHEEGEAVSGLTTLSCGNAPRQRWMSTSKAGGGEGLPRHRAGGGKRRWTRTPQPPHLQCPAVSAAVRQWKPVPARNGISFQYKKKPIHTKKYTVYLNQQSNIHWDVLHANAWRHSTTKNIFTYTRINATQYLNAKSTKWLLHLLFLTNKTLCWEKLNEVTAENTAQQDKNHSSASWERCGSGLIGKLVLEVPHSDRKRLEDSFYPEHREHKILLPGTDLTWNRSLRILMRGWEMQWWRQHEGKAPGKC